MVSAFVPPLWAKLVIVGGDAAYGSQAHMQMVQAREQADMTRRWAFACAIARTWKTVEDKTIKNLVTHVPHQYYQRTRVPREATGRGRRTFWTSHTRLSLRHVGDVTMVLSKRGRNMGSKRQKSW